VPSFAVATTAGCEDVGDDSVTEPDTEDDVETPSKLRAITKVKVDTRNEKVSKVVRSPRQASSNYNDYRKC
jgi:hypothetical protein